MAFSTYKYGVFSIARFAQAEVVKQTPKKILEVSIDSRKKIKNSLFVCLEGENTDGHNFILDAINNGASAILIKTSKIEEVLSKVKNIDVGVLAINLPLHGLQNLAKNYISQFSNINYTAVTGSVGKSTTKEAIASILSTNGNTVYTPYNFNSEIGLPLSLLEIDSTTKYGVFEMGIDHKGEMDRHMYMLKPNQALVTKIGLSHVEKIGSMRKIAKEKGKIFHNDIDLAFISKNCKYKKLICKNTYDKTIEYSVNDIKFLDNGLLGIKVFINNDIINLPIIGEHLLEDIVGAITLAKSIGFNNSQISEGLKNFKPMPGRGSIVDGNVTVIEDCYNASPTSTNIILNYLKSVAWKGNKKVVLGSMKELGRTSKKAHVNIAKSLYQNKLESAFLYGKEMENAYYYLKRENYSKKLFYSDNFEELKYAVNENKEKGDLFLLKGSRAMAIERLIPTLQGVI
ncbi:MAG: UDP-N-acetylmuramoyl-tripeptide--D-alanyl-D-alanine ligase [Pleomorphochaeta sp.]